MRESLMRFFFPRGGEENGAVQKMTVGRQHKCKFVNTHCIGSAIACARMSVHVGADVHVLM